MTDRSAVLEIDNPSNLDSVYAASQLQFQDFPRQKQTTSQINITSQSGDDDKKNNDRDDDNDDDEEELLASQNSDSSSKSLYSFYELGFFCKYFDVTTKDVINRIIWSAIPRVSGSSSSYIDRCIKKKPDLYGPLWISVTLIFSMAICGNITNYLISLDKDPNQDVNQDNWHYDFTKVGLAASTISTYTIGVPIALWFFFWFRGCTSMHSLVGTICAYSYSLSIFIPISIIWIIRLPLVQYLLLGLGTLSSGIVLILSFAPVVKSDPSQTIKFSYLILLVIMGLHWLLAFSFLIYFF